LRKRKKGGDFDEIGYWKKGIKLCLGERSVGKWQSVKEENMPEIPQHHPKTGKKPRTVSESD